MTCYITSCDCASWLRSQPSCLPARLSACMPVCLPKGINPLYDHHVRCINTIFTACVCVCVSCAWWVAGQCGTVWGTHRLQLANWLSASFSPYWWGRSTTRSPWRCRRPCRTGTTAQKRPAAQRDCSICWHWQSFCLSLLLFLSGSHGNRLPTQS